MLFRSREAMAVDVALDGAQALERLSVNDYDAVILDRDLPDISGDEVCQQIVTTHSHCRILMLTAARHLGDKVQGLSLGADDYMTKPFEFPELTARLRALQRRNPMARSPVLEVAGIRLDPFERSVELNNRTIELTRKEFAVLEVLMTAGGGTVSAEHLLEKVWDENADPFTNAVRITVSTLRAKLGARRTIETITGVGYRIREPDQDARV